jgi:hypothetical protein
MHGVNEMSNIGIIKKSRISNGATCDPNGDFSRKRISERAGLKMVKCTGQKHASRLPSDSRGVGEAGIVPVGQADALIVEKRYRIGQLDRCFWLGVTGAQLPVG